MNLNKIGKYILVVCAIVFVVSLLGMFLEYFYEPVGIIFILVSYVLFSISFALIFYNSIKSKRSKAIKVISIISCSVFALACFFKFMRWPGAAILILLPSFLFCFGCLPLIIKTRYENRKTLLTSAVIFLSLADLLSIIFILMGLLFKTLHWPGGNYLVISGSIILAITFIFWNISFRKEVKLRVVVEEKLKETLNEVEEKQKEITDSINYAKRIQEAILPSFDFIKTHLPNSFIYYQPKDIVAGDFYWAEKVDSDFFIAAADCTGHGVPGALVSVVCCNALNRTVNEFKLTDPGKILDKTRELVLESFSKSKEDIKDGMDISLVCINGNTVKWAGANNPLWYYQNNELKELKANKQPIGKTDNPEPFTTHTIELQKGDSLYLFTDGFADQFGGPKGKKFKYKQLEDLLVASNDLSINEQHLSLKNALNSWKGNLEQVDDICIIGIKV